MPDFLSPNGLVSEGLFLRDYNPSSRTRTESFTSADRPFPSPILTVSPFTPPKDAVQINGGRKGDQNDSKGAKKEGKPFSFALEKNPDSVTKTNIYYGCLVSNINALVFDVEGGIGGSDSTSGGGLAKYVSQTGIPKPIVTIPEQFKNLDDNSKNPFVLDWRGDVYLYWETDDEGKVNKCEIKGPDAPPEVPLPLPKDVSVAKFWVKIGNVPSGNGEINQEISSDVFWNGAFIKNPKESSGSSDSGGSSVSGGSSGSSGSSGSPGSASSAASGSSVSGSDKSTAIVPMPWHPKGYGALFTMESNEVLFDFVLRDIPILGRQTQVKIDPRFLYVCEQGSIAVTGAPCGPEPYPVGASVKGDTLTLSAYARKDRRPSKVTLKLTGVRRGFAGYDMPERSKAQFDANEKFLNSAYPAE